MLKHENCGGELVRCKGGCRKCKKCKEEIYTGWEKNNGFFGSHGMQILPYPSLHELDNRGKFGNYATR